MKLRFSINNFIRRARFHWLGILVSVCVGCVIVAPHLLFISKAGSSYRGIYMMTADAELHYLARMEEAKEGNGAGNPFVYEHKHAVPSALYSLAETVLAAPAVVLPVSIVNLSLFYKFALSVIAALLVYAFAFRLTKCKSLSAAAPLLVFLGYMLISLPDLKNLIFFRTGAYTQFLSFNRPVNPQFSSIFFLVFLHLILSVVKEPKKYLFILIALVYGISFYVYFYLFTFLTAILGILAVVLLVQKKWKSVSGVLLATTAGIVIGAGEIIAILKFTRHEWALELQESLGLMQSHTPVVSLAGVIITCAFLVWIYRKRNTSPEAITLLVLLLSAFAAINQQVLTGMTLQHGHYHWYFNTPIYLMAIVWLVREWYGYYPQAMRAAGICIAVASVYSGIFVQTVSYANTYSSTLQLQRNMSPIEWINTHAPKESVVLADDTLSSLIPVYTESSVVWEPHAVFYLLPKERREFTVERLIQNNFKDISKYRVDYVVWDTQDDPAWNLSAHPNLSQVFSDNGFIIYELKKR